MRDTRAHIVVTASVALVSVMLDQWPALAILSAYSCAGLLRARPGRAWMSALAAVVLGGVWVTVVSQALFYADEPRMAWARVGPITLWREGALHGLVQSLRLVSVSFAALTLAVRAAPEDLLVALRGLRVPHGLALIVAMSFRSLPTLLHEVRSTRAARLARGGTASASRPIDTLMQELWSLRPVVARSIRRAQVLGRALDTRGFDPLAPRTDWRQVRMPPSERAVVMLLSLLVLALAVIEAAMAAYTHDVWYHPALRPLYGFARDWL